MLRVIPTKNESRSPALDLFQIVDVLVWSPHTKRNISNLEHVQCRATGFILGRDYLAHKHLNKLNLLPLPYHSEINDLVYFFKCFKNIHKLISSIMYCFALVSNH